LTWLVLQQGWKTGYQINARALTEFPDTFSGFVKQRIRWSRNSYRCYFRAIGRGWLWKQPVITSVSVLQNLFGPFTLAIASTLFVLELLQHHGGLALLAWAWMLFGRAIKGLGHIVSEPEVLLYLPLLTAIFIVVMIPVKFYALATMNKQGWITRTPSRAIAEGQSSASLG
jgi:N-acetylglucosaminyltransferase